MDTFRSNTMKEDFQPVNWEKMFILTRYWKSDMEFYLEDMRFLHKLISKYSIWLKRRENSDEVSKMAAELQGLMEEGKDLLSRIKKHHTNLSILIENKTDKDSEVSENHEALENEIAQFVKNFRINRRKVFKVSEKVIDSENLTDLMRE